MEIGYRLLTMFPHIEHHPVPVFQTEFFRYLAYSDHIRSYVGRAYFLQMIEAAHLFFGKHQYVGRSLWVNIPNRENRFVLIYNIRLDFFSNNFIKNRILVHLPPSFSSSIGCPVKKTLPKRILR
jgi:hypothetical protein